jgi:membrane-bound ClpP family serine protease
LPDSVLFLPNSAFVLIVVGVLLIYCEFVWVGKLIFGIVGAILAICGIEMLSRAPNTVLGISLIGGAIVCFVVEAAFRTYFVAGTIATLLLGWGFWKLYATPPCILPQLAFPISALFGGITTALLFAAKRARQNKHSDV